MAAAAFHRPGPDTHLTDRLRMKFRLCWLALMLFPQAVTAHVFTQPYTLPVPFSIYAYAATGALLLSFVVIGLFSAAPSLGRFRVRPVPAPRRAVASHPWTTVGRITSVSFLVLCVLTGWFGSQNAFVNLNMTLFWIGFVLGLPYAVALFGDFYAPVNPWKTLTAWVRYATGLSFAGRVRYPAALGYWPALLLYMGFIWIELFAELRPRGLSTALAGYTVVNLAGAYVFGRHVWFRYGEFFGVFLRLIGLMSPRTRLRGADNPAAGQESAAAAAADGQRWRLPFVGLLDEPAPHLSLVLFILFMLSSTAFDGLHSTLPWVSLYWKHLYPAIAPWLNPAPGQQFLLSTKIYYLWQWLSLLLSPVVYMALFAGFVRLAKAITRSPHSSHVLVLRLAMSLVPIAFVYHLTHYYTVFLVQAGQIVRLASDPFGFGWNLFGTAGWTIKPVMLDVGSIWLTQVALILAGHIVSVYLAHVEALRIFGSARQAALSQLPMLGLMMVFTNLGLWILSLPLAGG